MMTPEEQDAIADAIRDGRYYWCRARLLAALAQAEKQGVLKIVIDELIDAGASDGGTEDVHEKVRDALYRSGWL